MFTCSHAVQIWLFDRRAPTGSLSREILVMRSTLKTKLKLFFIFNREFLNEEAVLPKHFVRNNQNQSAKQKFSIKEAFLKSNY